MTAPAPNPLLIAALEYAARGWPVVPLHTPIRHVKDAPAKCSCRDRGCGSIGKHPRTKDGSTGASVDTATIRRWWSDWPTANVGVATGRGLVVVDIDPAKADDGLSAFEASLPTTPMVLTGSGGRHYYFVAPEGVEVRNSASVLAPGVDVRGEGGLAVVPPSMHASGRPYGWDSGAHVEETPLADLPDDLLRRMTSRPRSRSSSTDGPNFMLGGRNTALTSLAGTLRRRGLTEPVILASLLATNDEQCSPPLDPKEVEKIARSVASYDPDPRSVARMASAPDGANDASEAWTTSLARTKDDVVRGTFGNLCTILRCSSRYGEAIWLNTMALTVMFRGRLITDGDVARIREEIERDWHFSPAQENVVAALRLVAEENARHPVRSYLEATPWDGITRIDGVAAGVLGVDTDIARRMLRAWFLSAVARIMRPGCKVDTALVLVGAQGALKSTFFKILGGEWFSDTQMDITDKDGLLQLASAWIYEWAEIENVTSRKHSSEIKAFVTSATDTFRPPFGRAVVRHPRSSVIVGSTNQDQFLTDDTGSRRFWILRVPDGWKVDVDLLSSLRDQLWAEALAAFHADEHWWLSEDDDKTREADAVEHEVGDPWGDAIADWILGRPSVRATELMTHALSLRIDQQTRGVEMRVASILRRLGWTVRKERTSGGARNVWRPRA